MKEESNIPKPLESTLESHTWEEFRQSGLLFYINTILHFIGWVIVIKVDGYGKVTGAHPARTKFRGFSPADTGLGHDKFAKHLSEIAPNFPEEIK